MTWLGRTIALAAAFAGAAASLAVANSTPEGTEPGELTFAEGTQEGERVRMIAGELDGRGVLYAEYYAGQALRYAVPYTKVYVDGEATSVRQLRDLTLSGSQTADGFTFTAFQGSTQLACTALIWGDTSANCVRDPSWVPSGSPECAAAFKGNTGRFQCNGIRGAFPSAPHDELLRKCSAPFRWEGSRNDCMMWGYNHPLVFDEVLAACTDAYRTDDERKFCMFYSLAPVNEKERVPPHIVRACGPHANDKATTSCVFEKHTGKKQFTPKPGPLTPTQQNTLPLANTPAAKSRASGARIDVGTGTWREHSLRVTGGMVQDEPILFVDAFTQTGELDWMQPLDRIVVGKQIRALREVTQLDQLRVNGQVITFRVVHAGKSLKCRSDATEMFATCR